MSKDNPFLNNMKASDETRKWLAFNVKEWDKKIMDKCAETGQHPSEVAMQIGRDLANKRKPFKIVLIEEDSDDPN